MFSHYYSYCYPIVLLPSLVAQWSLLASVPALRDTASQSDYQEKIDKSASLKLTGSSFGLRGVRIYDLRNRVEVRASALRTRIPKEDVVPTPTATPTPTPSPTPTHPPIHLLLLLLRRLLLLLLPCWCCRQSRKRRRYRELLPL